MPSIGPPRPPPPPKRRREHAGDDGASSPACSDKRRRVAGPAPPPATATLPRTVGPATATLPRTVGPATATLPRTVGPARPPNAASRSSTPDSGTGPALPPASKPVRVAGPAPPPAPLDQRPPTGPDGDSDTSDDDFGPAPPPAGGAPSSGHDQSSSRPAKSAFDSDPQFTQQPERAQRDEWMTLPPTQDHLAARMDPTKMRARKFNSAKSAASSGAMSSAWTETPEQKLKRLQDEALGITAPSNSAPLPQDARRSKDEDRRARKMRDKIDAARGTSLVEQHQDKGTGKEQEDDPSKRAFDYEKDMAVSGTVNHKQRREMLSKSKGFSDRFSSGSYL